LVRAGLVESSINIIFFLHPLKFLSQAINQLKLSFILFFEVKKNLFAIYVLLYHIVMDVILEFLITLFVLLKLWVLWFEVWKIALEKAMIEKKGVQGIDCSLWKSDFAGTFFVCISDQLEKDACLFSLIEALIIVIVFYWHLNWLLP